MTLMAVLKILHRQELYRATPKLKANTSTLTPPFKTLEASMIGAYVGHMGDQKMYQYKLLYFLQFFRFYQLTHPFRNRIGT